MKKSLEKYCWGSCLWIGVITGTKRETLDLCRSVLNLVDNLESSLHTPVSNGLDRPLSQRNNQRVRRKKCNKIGENGARWGKITVTRV